MKEKIKFLDNIWNCNFYIATDYKMFGVLIMKNKVGIVVDPVKNENKNM